MTKQSVYLFTSEFPFGKEETFLESEIKYLSLHFNLTILPRRINHSNMRPVDKGVEIDTRLAFFAKKKRYNKRYGWMNISFWFFLWHEKNNLSSVEAFKRISTFAAEYSQTYNFLKLQNITEPSILYSYWLNGVALALADFKNTSINRKNLKAISRAHRYDVYEDLYRPSFFPMRKNVIQGLDKIFFVADNGLELTVKKYMNNKKMTVSKLGITNSFQNSIFNRKSDDPSILKILSISNLVPVKRVHLIAIFLKRFAIENPQVAIVWNHFGDGTERKEIDDCLRDSPCNFKSVITNRILNIRLMEIISKENYSLFLNTSSSEGLPVSMMEAISNGIPIVATNVGGVSEIVNDVTGFLIPKDFDYHMFENALKFVFENISKSEVRREKIRCFWRENYCAEKNYNSFVNELNNL